MNADDRGKRPVAIRLRDVHLQVLVVGIGELDVAREGDAVRHRKIGGVQVDIAKAGNVRVKRMIYPPGFHWLVDMKPVVGTDLCMHAHVGFLARGEIHIEYADGCIVELKAPQIIAIDPGHDGWVVGKEPAVMIEFDFEGDTIGKLGMPASHRHS